MSDGEQTEKKLKMTAGTKCDQQEVAAENLKVKTCAHFVRRKKRLCKMSVAKGKEFCGEHEPALKDSNESSTQGNGRIPCPLDSKHTVYRKKLAKHLKICNARPTNEQPDYIQKNINAGNDSEEPMQENLNSIKLNDLTDEEFYGIIEKVKELYQKYVENKIENLECHHKCMDEELTKFEYGKESRKHLVQTAALLGILEKEQQIEDSTSFVEFGAGKGQLAFHLAKLLEAKKNSQVVLVDRMSLRHKKDNKIENRSLVQRIRADIADFCIDKLSALKKSHHCVAVSKHLCGGATDLTLRCICQAKEKFTNFIMIALCCHHRCDWRSFVGKQFFKQHQISQRDFVIITKMVSWAICGTGLSRERRKAFEEKNLSAQDITDSRQNQRLSLAERETIGFMCKRLLDYARLVYLRQYDYNAELYNYVPREVTLENVVLLARKKSNAG